MPVKLPSIIVALLLLAACAAGSDQSATIAAGAPTSAARPSPGSQDDLAATVGDRVFFGDGRVDLVPEARRTIQRWSDYLKKYPNLTVTIEGHCDERGTHEYNLALGQARATMAKNFLAALGIDPRRIDAVSYGKERPQVVGSNEAAWAQNRRAVMVIDERRRP